MNDKTKKKDLPGNLNKAELFALARAKTPKEVKKLLDSDFATGSFAALRGNLNKAEMALINSSKGKKERVAKSKMTSDEAYSLKDGGEVKKYMGGGSVHKNKNKMLTTKGWGASRKT